MTQSHHAFVSEAYGPRAGEYLASAVHASGEDLDLIEARVRGQAQAHALDLGCGGGHVAYRVAPHVADVVAVDLSVQMLDTVARAAAVRGLTNITTQQSAAESLPFQNGQFDFVLSRFSAHHWRDLDAGLREARRVMAPKGQAIFVDSVAPVTALLDSHLQTLELLRDPSHVRNYTTAEWVAALSRAGFEVTSLHRRRIRIEFGSWIARTRTAALFAEAIRHAQTNAPDDVRHYFEFETDGSFLLDAVSVEARAS
jgi:ubiquinone/menaquinone biosynthesis C-methylase UbiE